MQLIVSRLCRPLSQGDSGPGIARRRADDEEAREQDGQREDLGVVRLVLVHLGFGRIVASEIEVPILLVNLV